MTDSPPAGSISADSDVRSRLLRAAGPVFAGRGFDGATVREICSAADVNVASVAYYFGDKLGLYREVIESIRDSRERRFPAPADPDIDAEVMMFRLVHTMLSRMLTDDSSGWESQLLMREMQQPTPVFESIVNEFFRPLYDTLTATVLRLIGGDAPPHVVDQLALSVVGQCCYYRFGAGVVKILIPDSDRAAHYDIDNLACHITAVTLAATRGGAVMRHAEELFDRIGAIQANPDTSHSSTH